MKDEGSEIVVTLFWDSLYVVVDKAVPVIN
jgi:hypothetical protein